MNNRCKGYLCLNTFKIHIYFKCKKYIYILNVKDTYFKCIQAHMQRLASETKQ